MSQSPFASRDINPNALDGQRIAVVGYGSQGRGQSLNLRDSGLDVGLGLRPGGPSDTQAREDGWTPQPIADAVREADVVMILLPDTAQAGVYEAEILPNLKSGAMIMFSHGFNIHYKEFTPPEGVDVSMVAPKGPGAIVRREYEQGGGVPCLIAVHADATGTAWDRAYAYCAGIGGTRAGVVETTFDEETETDLFGEQAVLCGGATELVVAGYETLVEAGYKPEVAYFECMHELKLIVDLLHEGGIAKMHEFISDTASWGDLVSGKRVVNEGSRQAMKDVLTDIQDGTFARTWIEENKNGCPNYKAMKQADMDHPIEVIGKTLRAAMPWLSEADGSNKTPEKAGAGV